MSEPTALAGPVKRADRIDSLDVLRGVAVLGILVMNIIGFSQIGNAYMVPSYVEGGIEEANGTVYALQRMFADQKFMSLFSMMFGAGVLLSTRRADEAGRAVKFHYTRTASLFAIGMIHAYLLWFGDILVLYAVCGAVVFLFRKLSPTALIWSAAGFVALSGVLLLGMGARLWAAGELGEQDIVEMMEMTPEAIAAEVAAFRGSYAEQAWYRLTLNVFNQPFMVIFFGPRVLGLMLAGMALLKLGLFDARTSVTKFLPLLAIGLVVGLPITIIDTILALRNDDDILYMFSAAMQWNYWGSAFLALAYIPLIMFACKIAGALLTPIAAVGRMALTNYLAQSVIATAFFYTGDRFQAWERTELVWFVLAVWVVQLVWSPIWLTFFRFGPAEWLWRSVNYAKPQPLLRSAA
ncbi:MAG: DUF418 domain-containing protein [Planctomycetota bacterium]